MRCIQEKSLMEFFLTKTNASINRSIDIDLFFLYSAMGVIVMSQIEITLESDNIDMTLQEFQRAAKKAMKEIGLQAERNTKKEATNMIYNAPLGKSGYRRTGNLRKAITHESTDREAIVGCDIEYAQYVELGTSKMPARPFIENGVRNYQEQYIEILKKNLTM